MTDPELVPLLRTIADALDRLAPHRPPASSLNGADAFVWHPTAAGWSPLRR